MRKIKSLQSSNKGEMMSFTYKGFPKASTVNLAPTSISKEVIFRLQHRMSPSLNPQSSAAKLLVMPIRLLKPIIHLPPQPAKPGLPLEEPSVFEFQPTLSRLLPSNPPRNFAGQQPLMIAKTTLKFSSLKNKIGHSKPQMFEFH